MIWSFFIKLEISNNKKKLNKTVILHVLQLFKPSASIVPSRRKPAVNYPLQMFLVNRKYNNSHRPIYLQGFNHLVQKQGILKIPSQPAYFSIYETEHLFEELKHLKETFAPNISCRHTSDKIGLVTGGSKYMIWFLNDN